mgnify:CR=1 FL=1
MTIEYDAKRGVAAHYGVRTTDAKYGGQAKSTGKIKRAEWSFDYNDLPDAEQGNLAFAIPANATVVSATLIADADWTGGTSFDVGLQTSAGAEIDNDGLIVDVTTPSAGDVVTGAGALVGATIGASAGEVAVTGVAGTYTGGSATLIVEYYV